MTHRVTHLPPAAKLEDDPVVIGMRIANAIVHMVNQPPMTAYANRTFGDFIQACRELGVRDEDPLSLIHFGTSDNGSGLLRKEWDEDGAIEIHEFTRDEVR